MVNKKNSSMEWYEARLKEDIVDIKILAHALKTSLKELKIDNGMLFEISERLSLKAHSLGWNATIVEEERGGAK